MSNNTTQGFTDGAEQRRRNRGVVDDYLGRRGENRLTRYLLFTEDGSAGLYTADTAEPIVSRGHEKLKAHGEWSLKMFPDWVWSDIRVFETQNPDHIWAECEGDGKILYPGYAPGHYHNHFLHSFEFRDGRIFRQREFMNPFNQLRALGIDVPTINRGGIPT